MELYPHSSILLHGMLKHTINLCLLLLLLNVSLLRSRQRHIGALRLMNFVKSKISFLPILDGLLPVCGLLQLYSVITFPLTL
jgi:hypothetical protein